MPKLSKFPVTMPDGTEYRVVINDRIHYHKVRIYIEREKPLFGLWRFKKVATSRWAPLNTPDDYVTSAEHAVRKYEDSLRGKADRERRKFIFSEWDGKINDGGDSQ